MSGSSINKFNNPAPMEGSTMTREEYCDVYGITLPSKIAAKEALGETVELKLPKEPAPTFVRSHRGLSGPDY